jgi:hypothetical protein
MWLAEKLDWKGLKYDFKLWMIADIEDSREFESFYCLTNL